MVPKTLQALLDPGTLRDECGPLTLDILEK